MNNPTVNADGQPVNAQGAATLEFKKRIDAYIKIHNEAEGKVPAPKKTDDPKEISEREKALGDMIMTLRANAQPGDIFAPDYQPYFIKIRPGRLQDAIGRGSQGADQRAAREDEGRHQHHLPDDDAARDVSAGAAAQAARPSARARIPHRRAAA